MGWGWYQSIGTVVDENSNSSYQTWESYDVTSVIKKHLSNPTTNNGFMIRMDDWATVTYSSSESSNTSLRPRLIIEYEGGTGIITDLQTQKSSREYVTVKNNEIQFMADGAYTLTLISLQGKVLNSISGQSSGETAISLERLSLAKGIYVMQCITEVRNVRKRIVIP